MTFNCHYLPPVPTQNQKHGKNYLEKNLSKYFDQKVKANHRVMLHWVLIAQKYHEFSNEVYLAME